MPVRTASAEWQGTLKDGGGTMATGSGAFSVPYTWSSRFESGAGTNPEELVGAAHAGCYTMFLSSLLTKAGFTPTRLSTTATVHLESGTITLIELATHALVPNLTAAELQTYADEAKKNCPVSKALAGPEIKLRVTLDQ